MKQTNVRAHSRSVKGKHNTRVRNHARKIAAKHGAGVITLSKTHRIYKGKKQVFVDGFWKHDDYPVTPTAKMSKERLLKERAMYMKDLQDGLHGIDILPPRKFGLLTRRIRKINRLLEKK